MKTYEVELDDGRVFEVDAEQAPSHEEVYAALGMGQEQRPMVDTGQGVISSSLGQIGRDIAGIPKSAIGGAGAALSLIPGMENNWLQTGADELEEWYKGIIPVNPVLEQSVPVKVGGAVGQGVGFLGLTLGTAGLGATPAVASRVGLGTAGLMGAEQGEETANLYGVEDPMARATMILGSGVLEGVVERIGGIGAPKPTEALLGAMKSAILPGRGITRAAKTIASEGVEEMITGQGQDWMTQAIVEEDPDRPGFARNGAALPPDAFTMENLYNRLEEGALGAVGGTVFAGAEALGSRTQVDEALSLRMQAHSVLNDLQGKESLTPEEQDTVNRMQAEDQNLSAWLERQGFDAVRPALDQIINNPQSPEPEKAQAAEYAALIDNLAAVESSPEATPEEKAAAHQAVESHPLNGLNPLARTRQDSSISGAFEDRLKEIKRKAEEQASRTQADPVLGPLTQTIEQTISDVAQAAPEAAEALQSLIVQPQTQPTDAAIQNIQPEVLQGKRQSGSESRETPETSGSDRALSPTGIQEEGQVNAPATTVQEQPEVSQPVEAPQTQTPSGAPARAKLRRRKTRLGLAVSPREVERAVTKFSKIGPVRIASVEELANDPVLKQSWMESVPNATEEMFQDWVANSLSTSEGLSTDGTGSPVIIPNNLAIYDTDVNRARKNQTTAGEEAMIRVLFHENWHGIERWLNSAPEAKALKDRYDALLNEISEEELDDLASRRYPELSGWRDDSRIKSILQSEVMAERREEAAMTGEADSLIEKFLAWLRDVFKAVTGSAENPTPDELQELFDAWHRAQKTSPERSPVQLSRPEIPQRPQVALPTYTPPTETGNTLEEVLDYMWTPFYTAWESNQEGPVDQQVLAQAWQEEVSDPDYLFGKDWELKLEKKSGNWQVYDPAPSQTEPETGTQPFQSSQPERTPEQRAARLSEIADRLSYTPSTTQQEGQTPAQATQDQRQYATDGTDVEMYRQGTTSPERQGLAKEALDLAIDQSPDGPSEGFGKDLMRYLSGEIPTLNGLPNNPVMRQAIAINLENSPQDRAQLGIDGGDLRKTIQNLGSQAGAALQAMANTIYKPLQEIAKKADEQTETEAQKELGTDDFKGLADTAKEQYVKDVTAAAPDVLANKTEILEAAQNDADEIDYMEMGFEGMDPKLVAKIRELNDRVERLGRLKARRAQLLAAQKGPAASRPEIPDNLTLEELDKLIAEEEASIKKLTAEIEKAEKKASKTPKEKKDRKPKKQKVANNASFYAYVEGAETADLAKFDDLVKKYINPAGFNQNAFYTLLSNKFQDADPNFIMGVVVRVANALNGAATEEGAEQDVARKPNLDARAKRIVVRSLALGAQPEDQEKEDAFKNLTIQRLKEEIPADEYMQKLEEMGVEEQTAFAMNRKVEEDTSKRKEAAAQRKAVADAKRNAAEAQREAEKFAKKAESTIEQLAKEFSDTLSRTKQKDIDAYKALLNNFIGKGGPPIPEEEFIERAKALNIPESTYTRLIGVLGMQRKRATAVADAKNRQKEVERLAREEAKEREKHAKEAESKISALAKEFSDTLPAATKQKDLTELQRLINDYTGKNGPVISDEAFEARATALNIPESVLNRLRGVLQMQRKRESMTADAKARQKEAERLENERLKFEREALRDIDKFATEFSDTLSQKAKKDASDLKTLSNSFLGKSGPPITEEQFLEGTSRLNLTDQTAQKLLKVLQEARRRDVAVRYAKASQKAQEAKRKAIEALVKKLDKVKNPTPRKLKQRSAFVNAIMGAMETGILDSEAVKNAFAQAYDLHGLTQDRLKALGEVMQTIESLPEGMVRETLMNELNVLINSVAPTASFITHAHSGLMGHVLSGASTMLMQLTGLNRFINPLSGTVEILWSAPGTAAEKLGRTINPSNFFKLYLQGLQEVKENLPLAVAGISGIKDSTPKGLGASPSSLASVVPRETSLSYTPWGQVSEYRFQTPKLLKQMGLDKMVQATRYPAWMVSRSFQVIRAAEGIVGGADKNMQWRSQMTIALMQQDPKLSWSQAYSKVSDALGDKTTEMWEESYKQADEEISKGLISKASRKQRATELAQDKLEEQWQSRLKNRPRELSALYGYKQDPLTPLGAWLYSGLSGVLNRDKGPLQALKFSFLFARFFSNALESAWSRTPLGGLTALAIDTSKPEGKMDEREKRIVQIFGSLKGYKDARMARAMSGTAVMSGIAGLMVLALKGWDPDDDEPPFFWITGEPVGEFSKKGMLESNSWWKANTLYIGPLRINYVNSAPEQAMTMALMGSLADRFMFDKLLNYTENKETGEYERSNFQAYGKPMIEALAAPWSRSTFSQWKDMLESAYDGNFTKLTKAISNPVVGTAVALSPAAMVPSIKTLEKFDRSTEQPRSAQSPLQAAMGSVPFADEIGLDAGKPLTTPFGNPLTPFPFWSVFSNSQEVPPEVSKAARLLTDLGVSRLGPREEYFGWGMAEIAHDGKKYLLNDSERAKVLQDIGSRFASKLNSEASRLRKIESGEQGRKKVRDAISNIAEKARAETLRNYRPTR